MTETMKQMASGELSDDSDIIRSSPDSIQTKMKKTPVHRTIAKSTISKIYFPELTLKKNINSCPPKPLTTAKEKHEHSENLEIKKKSNQFSPAFNNLYAETPPFVTKKRPAPRNISSFLFNSGTDSSCNNSGEAENKLSDSKIFENILPKTHSTPTVEEHNEMSYRSSNKSRDVSPETPKCSDSNDIDPELANLMDNMYGEVWRSTPGLFKSKKPEHKCSDIDELTNKIGNMDLSKNKNVSNDSVILLSDDDLNEIEKNDRNDDSFEENVPKNVQNFKSSVLKENNYDIFQISGSKEKSLNFENDRLKSNFFDDKSLKPSKLDFSDAPKHDKENLKIPTKKTVSKKKETSERKIPEEKPKKKSPLATEDIQLYSFMASLGDNIPSWRMEYKAKYYKDNYKTKKEELAKILFKMFNENVFESKLDPNLSIIWSQTLNKTAGKAFCKTIKVKKGTEVTITRAAHIELSIKVLDSTYRLRRTLAHEMCHVATWIIDGVHDGHGSYWKSWTYKVIKRYPEIESISTCHNYEIHFKYSYKCTKCGYKINRHSKSIDIVKKRCGYCYGTFECILNKKTKDGLIVSTPSKQRKVVNGFALYVKENYSNARSGSTPHKDVMKYLGKQYAILKSQPQVDN